MLLKTFLLFLFFALTYALISFDFCTYQFHTLPTQGMTDTIYGGIILTLILFLVKEYLFNINLTGEWLGEEKIISSTETIDPVNKIQYVFHLLQKGAEIVGEGEKISEDSIINGHIQYERKARVRVHVQGYLQRNYFRKSSVFLLIIEDGPLRKSSSSFELLVQSPNLITGQFSSTAADAKGRFTLTKTFPS